MSSPLPTASPTVRVETSETSIGRSYGGRTGFVETIPGLGARRRALTTRSFAPAAPLALDSASMALVNLRAASRADVLAYFRNTWALTDTLFSALATDASYYAIADKLRRPLIFYFGHPAALYINKMHQAGLADHVNPFFQKLFETGVDEMSWDDMDVMQSEDFNWPDVADVQAFREQVKGVVEALILGPMPEPAQQPVDASSPWWALFLAFEHEKIHLETSSVLMRQLPLALVAEPPGWRTAPSLDAGAAPAAAAADPPLLRLPAATVTLGKPRDFPSFGWDNEYGQRVVSVPAFELSPTLVSNAQFLAFVEAGGYETDAWWIARDGDDEGLRWRRYRNARHPSFWVASAHPDMARFLGGTPGQPLQPEDGKGSAEHRAWRLRAQFSLIPMPWDWPAEVNFLEAAAFLRWKGAQEGGGVSYRVPTEAEYHVARGGPSCKPAAPFAAPAAAAAAAAAAREEASPFPLSAPAAAAAAGEAGALDIIMRAVAPGNTNWRYGSPTPVTYFPPSPAGAYDTAGSVWEWVADHFAPLPGFEIHYLYDDFSAPCYDGWHTMILGGSWVSSGNLASSYARYHFRRHFFQHLGFRYVRLPAGAPPEPYPGAPTVANLWEGSMDTSRELTSALCPAEARLPAGVPLAAATLAAAAEYPAALARAAHRAYAAAQAAASAMEPACPSPASPAPALPSPSASPAASAEVLHIGCGVGAGTFELCRHFAGGVVGADASEPSIRHARILQHHGQFEYERVREGVLTAAQTVHVGEGVPRARAHFVCADLLAGAGGGSGGGSEGGSSAAAAAASSATSAAALELTRAGPYPVVVFDGLLTACRNPRAALAALTPLVCSGGLLLISSANSWSAAATPRNSWLGGFKMNGEDQGTLSQLQYALKSEFTLVETLDLPRASQQHERSLTLEVMQVSVWRRREHPVAPGVRGFRRVI